ncbi:MAG TPA: NlpC/P60 family protein [Desulfuromonadaceae bacterium]|jgi:LysM repeat protein
MAHTRLIAVICLILLVSPQLVLASKTHVVRKSESLVSVARKYQVSVDELKSVNNISGTHVNRGARLIIPSYSQKKKTDVVENASIYKVTKGDTLPRIARKTGVKMSELRRLNSLKGNRIKVGMMLALNEAKSVVTEEAPRAVMAANRLELVNRNLLNEQELSATLAELSDIEVDHPVDLAKSLEENSPGINKIKKSAYSFLGARYRFGGNSRNALDCSSFVQQVFREQKISLPRTAREQFYVGSEVMRGDLQKGDLVFFQTYARFASHVGIYLGNRKMIHASSRDRRVVISSMDTPYYLNRFLGARRIGSSVPDGINFNELLRGVEEERDGDVLSNDTLNIELSAND